MLRTIGIVAGIIAFLAVSSVVWLPAVWPSSEPTAAEARNVVFGDLVAYSDEAGEQPWVAFDTGPGSQVVLDQLAVDRSPYPEFPALPRPRLKGAWHAVASTESLVDAGFVEKADGLWLFGEIDDERVAYLEVGENAVAGRFEVGAPGFIVRALPAIEEESLHLRWLDVDGRLLLESEAFAAR